MSLTRRAEDVRLRPAATFARHRTGVHRFGGRKELSRVSGSMRARRLDASTTLVLSTFMLVFGKRWTVDVDDDDERRLRTIVDLGALAGGRRRVGSLLLGHPRYPDVDFDERTVLEVALLTGLRVLATDLERELGTPLDREDGDNGTGGETGGRTPPAQG